MKKAIFALGILLSSAMAFGQANTLMKGLNIVAPTVNGKANVYSPAAGEIIFDTSDSQFYGNDGMSNWLPLSGTSGANTTLSNLSGTTAVNQDFFPDSTASGRAMGDFDHFWGALFSDALVVKDRHPGHDDRTMGEVGNGPDLPSGSESSLLAMRGIFENALAASSASVAVYTWSEGGGGNTGHIYLETGNTSGTSGNILMRTGTGASSRGYIGMDALYVKAPQGTSDPTAPAGSVYYNTSTNKLRLYDGTSWVSLN